jgi:hypothetical protein
MHAVEILDGLLRDLCWLRESTTLRRRTRSLWPGQAAAVRPMFCEVVIEWDDSMSDGHEEPITC